MPKALELEAGDELTKEQAMKYYTALMKSCFEKELGPAEKDKFWRGLESSGAVNAEGRVSQDELLKANIKEWMGLTPMLQDLEVTVYEVEETFPTMYNMQKVVKGLTSRISGVEQETINWQKRINKQQKAQKNALRRKEREQFKGIKDRAVINLAGARGAAAGAAYQ